MQGFHCSELKDKNDKKVGPGLKIRNTALILRPRIFPEPFAACAHL
jgi:hypothetical protein